MRIQEAIAARRPLIFILPVLIAAVWLFGHGLRSFPLRPFDEARLAISAAEMSLYGDWLVTHHDGQPDLWNVKPPLMIWLQAGAIKIFGYSVAAVRAPSFLAALATVALVFAFAASSLRNWRAGVLACVVLITSGGYVQWHVARSADYDVLLILFQTAQLMCFFNYTEHQRGRDWWAFVAAVILAVMTKGVVGLAPLPAIAAYAAGTNMLRPLLTSVRFYGGSALFLAVAGGFYIAREWATPGYLMAVWHSEISGRLLMPLNGQGGSWYGYLRQMVTKDFVPGILLVPLCAAIIQVRGEAVQRRAAVLMLAFAATWLVVISAARTKMFWYEAPVYPPLALITGLGLAHGWDSLKARGLLPAGVPGLSLALFAAVFAGPLSVQAGKVRQEGLDGRNYRRYLPYLDSLPKKPLGARDITLLVRTIPILATVPRSSPCDPDRRYEPVFKFYRLAYAETHGLRLTIKTIEDIPQLRAGELVTTCEDEPAEALASARRTTIVDRKGPCATRKLEGEPTARRRLPRTSDRGSAAVITGPSPRPGLALTPGPDDQSATVSSARIRRVLV